MVESESHTLPWFNIAIRHGERCDNTSLQEELAKVEYPWEPPLSKLGEN